MIVVFALAVPLGIAATAFACANLATLKLDSAGATPGSEVAAVGRNFNTSPAASPVQLRFNSRNGRVLYEGRPSAGKLRGTFTVPRVRPGDYVIVATQIGPNGRIAAGTPGRAPLKVRSRSRSSSSGAIPAAPWAAPPSAGGPSAPQTLPPLGLGLLAIVLLGGATALVASARRRRLVPGSSVTAPSAS